MPKEIENITEAVMGQIHRGKIKMRPKLYFAIGSLLTFTGLVLAVVTSVFFVSLTRFFLRAHGPMAEYRLERMLSSFPWWAPVIAIIALALGIWILRHYDFSYKKGILLVAAGFILAIMAAGWFLDMTGLNESLSRRGPMQGMMRQYLQYNNSEPGPGSERAMFQFDRGQTRKLGTSHQASGYIINSW